MTILHIDSSILGGHSVSRKLSADIVTRLKTLHPGVAVIYHDLTASAPLHLSAKHVAIMQGGPVTDPEMADNLARGGSYVEELLAADIIVIGAPLYNFTIPTQLKGWIDRILVAGKTFAYNDAGDRVGLCIGKKVFIASARGGIYSGDSPFAVLEHQESYLRSTLGFIGLTDVTVIRAEGLRLNEDTKAAAISKAEAEIAALAA